MTKPAIRFWTAWVVTIPVKHMTRASQSFVPMTRGDHVFIVRGDWEGKRGSVVFVDHVAGLVTISLDVGLTHMIKTPIQNVVRVISNGDVV